MSYRPISETNRKAFLDCTSTGIIRMLSVCPKAKEEFKKIYNNLKGPVIPFSAYDYMLGKHGMSVNIIPVYYGDTEAILYFTFKYCDEGREVVYNEAHKSLSRVQIRAVHETMYQLERKLERRARKD